jgi:hypothetical protein
MTSCNQNSGGPASGATRFGYKIWSMLMFLKRVRWAVLLGCYVVVAKTCSLFRISPPMSFFFRPHNLIRFRPYYIASRTCITVRRR